MASKRYHHSTHPPPFLPLEETSSTTLNNQDIETNANGSVNSNNLQPPSSTSTGALRTPPPSGNLGAAYKKNDDIVEPSSSSKKETKTIQINTLLHSSKKEIIKMIHKSKEFVRKKKSVTSSTSSTSHPTSPTSTSTNSSKDSKRHTLSKILWIIQKNKLKMSIVCFFVCIFCFLFYDSFFHTQDNKYINFTKLETEFLHWVQNHPLKGLFTIVIVIAVNVIFMIPVGTPITIGCGYIYKHLYGWTVGITIATTISMGGSALGAVSCFLLGRYLMREQVRKWIKNYPMFDAIDVATAEHGLRIMAMLYLTPILPLGPVSYMCGTTSMKLSSFALAKIAALPLMLLYVYIGAATGELVKTTTAVVAGTAAGEEGRMALEQQNGGDFDAALAAESQAANPVIIISGIVLSMVMISLISYHIKKELYTILERQKKHKPGEMNDIVSSSSLIEDEYDNAGTATTRQRRRRPGGAGSTIIPIVPSTTTNSDDGAMMSGEDTDEDIGDDNASMEKENV